MSVRAGGSVKYGVKDTDHQKTVEIEHRPLTVTKKAVIELEAEASVRLRIPMRLDVDFRDLTIRPAGRWELKCDCEAVAGSY